MCFHGVAAEVILHIAGIAHDDPQGRTMLLAWFKTLEVSMGCVPAFVAVEHDPQIFMAKFKAERPLLGELLSQKLYGFSTDLLEAMERSLGYEGDAHTEIWPTVETVWLNEDRTSPSMIASRAEARANGFEDLAKAFSLDAMTTIPKFSELVWGYRDDPTGDWTRDRRWVDRIGLEIARHPGKAWCSVVVGAYHAGNYQGNMVSLLRARGYHCEVEFMTPAGPSGTEPVHQPRPIVW